MTGWPVVWLGTMAVALVVMSLVQAAVVVVAIVAARRAARAAEGVRSDLKPLLEKVTRITDDAARASALAVAQVERIDEMLTVTVQRVDETVGLVQDVIGGPVRQGTALLAAFRAAMALFRQRQSRDRPARDDDDALFIG